MNLKFWALLLLSATLAMACSGESNDAAATADGGGGGAGAKILPTSQMPPAMLP